MFLYSDNVYFILSQKSEKCVTERSKRFNLWSLFGLMVSMAGFHCGGLSVCLYFYIKQANQRKGNLSTHFRSSCLQIFFRIGVLRNIAIFTRNQLCLQVNQSLCSLFFINFYFFTKWQPFKNYEKCFLFHLRSSFHSWDIQIFVFLTSLSAIALKGDSRKTLKVYDLIICLNKNLVTCFVWHLEKEIRCDIETLVTYIVLNTEDFYGKNNAENVHQKLVPDPFLILPNNSKQTLHAGNFTFSFESNPF